MVEYPLGCLFSGQNVVKCLLGRLSSGLNMVKCPLVCPSSGQNLVMCLIGCLLSAEKKVVKHPLGQCFPILHLPCNLERSTFVHKSGDIEKSLNMTIKLEFHKKKVKYEN